MKDKKNTCPINKTYPKTAFKSLPFICLLLNFYFSSTLSAQTVPAQDSTNTTEVLIQFSELMEIMQEEDRSIRKLSGGVALKQDSMLMYCDTAYMEGNQVIAYGNVIIQQNDSLTVFADSLVYRGDTKVADLFGEVVLEDGEKRLFTNYLNYDLNSKTGRYTQGGFITQGSTQLISKKGVYSVNSKQLYFKDSVVVVNDKFTLRADTLEFDSEAQIVTFLGPTIIKQDSTKIYCEAGFYDIETELAEFEQNAQYQKGEQKAMADLITYDGSLKQMLLEGNAQFIEGDKLATADAIRYEEDTNLTFLEGNAYFKDKQQEIKSETIKYDAANEAFTTSGRSRVDDAAQILEADQLDFDTELGSGTATGNVYWQDTIENITIRGEHLEYDKTNNYVKATGNRPLLSTLIGRDTMFLASDTLISSQSADSTANKMLQAINDVRIYKDDLQATCDSLVYSAKDSLFKLYKNPIIWSDTSQFVADSIHMQLANNQVDRILLYQNSLIINTPDFKFFNQIKGKIITAFFKYGELNKMEVEGNAECIYFAREDNKDYLGMNQTTCSEMLVLFGSNEVSEITFFGQPTADMLPMIEVQDSPPTLTGFKWEFKERPQSVVDLRKVKTRKATKIESVQLDSTILEKIEQPERDSAIINKKTNLSKPKE